MKRVLSVEKQALVDAVKVHALQNYTRGGWDIVVEAWERDDIAEVIGNATTEKQAIARVRRVVRVHGEQRDAVLAEVW